MHRNIWTAVPRQEHTTASASNGGAPITRSRVVTGHSSFGAYRHDCARFGWTVEHRCQAVLPSPVSCYKPDQTNPPSVHQTPSPITPISSLIARWLGV
jgi:hypothetical protein